MTLREVFEETNRCLNGEKPRNPKEFQKALDTLMAFTSMNDIDSKPDEKAEIEKFFNNETNEVPASFDLELIENIQNFCPYENRISSDGNCIYHLYLNTDEENKTSNRIQLQVGKNYICVYVHFDIDENYLTIADTFKSVQNAVEHVCEKYNQISCVC